jgi:hypothetical protein
VGVNTFLPKELGGDIVTEIELILGEGGPQAGRGGGSFVTVGDRAGAAQCVRQHDGGGEDAQLRADQPCVVLCGWGVQKKYVI